jgi:hypothetical protein
MLTHAIAYAPRMYTPSVVLNSDLRQFGGQGTNNTRDLVTNGSIGTIEISAMDSGR